MHTIIPIEDLEDARLNLYRDIKERDLRRRTDHFIAEGKVVIERLLQSRHYEAHSIFTTHSRLEALLPSLKNKNVTVYIATQAVMDQVAGFSIHRGYLAIGLKLRPVDWHALWSPLMQKPKLKIIVLSGVANTDNMGGVFRNAAAFGVDCVLLDETCCDPLYRKAIRVSVGGVFQMPHLRLKEWYEQLQAHDIIPYALSPKGFLTLEEIKIPSKMALVIGAEGPGLSDEIMKSMQTVRINMAAGFDSLNLATTSGIALYALGRD